ncbi:DNA topoisomerase 6 subunit A [Tanacetum coccineum]
MLFMPRMILKVVLKNIDIIKRLIYYTNVGLYKTQDQCDDTLHDICTALKATRISLNVVAAEKGVVVRNVVIRDDGDEIDCSMGICGKAIPSNIERLDGMRSTTLFILLVEKDSIFSLLVQDGFYRKNPCIIMGARGQPDVTSR